MDDGFDADRRVPGVVWAYGALGLVPFVAGAVGAVGLAGAGRGLAQAGLLLYGGLILAFLGGARFGQEIARPAPRAGRIGAAMAGAILATVLVAVAGAPVGWRLGVLALAHVGQWAWDVRTVATPVWYPRLRHGLSAGAVLSLLVGAAASLR